MSRFSQAPDYYSSVPYSDIPIVPGGLNRTKKLNTYYIDINSQYSVDQKGLVIYDTDAIKNEISNILATPIGSDHFEPLFGSNLPYRLFDPITARTAFLIYNDTIGAITRWMRGRIQVNQSLTIVRPLDNDPASEGYEIRMPYQIILTKVIAEFNAFILR